MTSNRAAAEADVSVIVATYNRAGYLGEALDSLIAQTVAPREVIVVDDGSTDATPRVLAAYGNKIRVLRKSNGGKSGALNAGLPLARGRFLWIFDDDDIAASDALERLLPPLAADPSLGFTYGGNGEFRILPDGSRRDEIPAQAPIPPDELYPALLEACLIHQGAMLVRKACYDAVGRFDERLVRSQDYDMLLRLARSFPGHDIGGAPVYMRRMHDGLRGREGDAIAADRLREGWRRFDAMMFRAIHASHALEEYLPGGARAGAGGLAGDDLALALARRAAVMARKGLWELAADDIGRFAEALTVARRSSLQHKERLAFASILDGRSHCRDDVALGRAGALVRRLKGLRDRGLAEDIRASMLAGTGLRQTLRLVGRLSTPADVMRAGLHRLRAGAGSARATAVSAPRAPDSAAAPGRIRSPGQRAARTEG